jgi:hypothetical protein
MVTTTPDLPEIDPDAIRTYCDVLFGYLDGQVPVRFIGEKGTGKSSATQRFYAPSELAEQICRAAPQAAARHEAIYVVPCTVHGQSSAKAEDIVATGVVVVDIDKGDTDAKRDHLVRHLGTPSMMVASGGITEDGQTKYHLYWRLSEVAVGEDLTRAIRLRAIIAAKVGGDDSFKVATQPIRVAGTIHGKFGKPSPVRLLSHGPDEYHISDLADAIEAMPPLVPVMDPDADTAVTLRGPTARDLMTRVIRENGQDEETRFVTLSKIIGHWIRMMRIGKASRDYSWQAIQEQNAATIRPPWDEERLRREFEALLRVDVRNHGPMPMCGDHQPPSTGAPEFSEDALAQEFVVRFGKDWRHIAVWGQWLHWTGTVWKRDMVGLVMEHARHVCRDAGGRQNKPADQRRLASARTMQAVVRIAGTDPQIAIDAEELDQHLMLLNTPKGVIDLETGIIGPHVRIRDDGSTELF